jgi:uncharacterized membrane protein YgaE (UPF0421/DUF939 family)
MSLLSQIQAEREVTRASFVEACVYAGQAVIATIVVLAVYRWAGKSNGMWAAVSAVLVLQPGFQRSLAASLLRVVANLMGVAISIAVGLCIANRVLEASVALTLTILACELAKLDAGVRSACASVLIISLGTEPLLERGMGRASAVAVGCGIALVLQLMIQPLIEQVRRGLTPAEARGGADAE